MRGFVSEKPYQVRWPNLTMQPLCTRCELPNHRSTQSKTHCHCTAAGFPWRRAPELPLDGTGSSLQSLPLYRMMRHAWRSALDGIGPMTNGWVQQHTHCPALQDFSSRMVSQCLQKILTHTTVLCYFYVIFWLAPLLCAYSHSKNRHALVKIRFNSNF